VFHTGLDWLLNGNTDDTALSSVVSLTATLDKNIWSDGTRWVTCAAQAITGSGARDGAAITITLLGRPITGLLVLALRLALAIVIIVWLG
jgi:hypothetical protein